MLETLIGEQYKGKDKLIAPNIQALPSGHDYARDNLPARSGCRCGAPTRWATASSINGNDAAGLGASMAAPRSRPGIPSRPRPRSPKPSASIASATGYDPETGKNKFAIVQAEDEISAIGTVIGAGWNGARAFTATSGPGISLMQEFLGLAYFAEIPAVIIDVQRGGPSTGMPTRTQQADMLTCAYASHGDTKHVLLFPKTRRNASNSARCPSIWPSGCRRRSSSWTTSISA